MELFDLIDRDDTVVGTTDKKTAHANGDLHRVSAVFVFNQAGELYIQVHGSDGKWDHSVGGHVSKGETYAEAAKREAEEELGITQPLTELATSLTGDEYPEMQHRFGLYECTVGPDWKFVPNDEVKEIFPMTIEAIRQAMIDEPHDRFTRGFRITMAEYVRQKGL
ncbi:MAG: NUDIX domain-containing protein [Candidatus Microsaccharimonas sp.]